MVQQKQGRVKPTTQVKGGVNVYANWGAWFDRRYQRNAMHARNVVLNHGVAVNGGVDLDHDYDLDNDTPTSNRITLINGQITALLNQIDPLQREFDRIGRSISPEGKNRGRLAAMRRIRTRMTPHVNNLRALERPYPTTLVRNIRIARAAPLVQRQASTIWENIMNMLL